MVKLLHHLRNLNACHFGMVEATGSEMRLWGSLEWRHVFTKFLGNPPIGSKVIRGQTDRQTHRQAGDLTSLLSFSFIGSRVTQCRMTDCENIRAVSASETSVNFYETTLTISQKTVVFILV
jgi:hypothetical protein